MIQRVIDWYNGYTLQDKLELEWLLNTAKELAIDEMNNTGLEKLQHSSCSFDAHSKGKNNKNKDLLNGDYTMEVKMVIVNTNASFFKTPKSDIVRQLLLLSEEGSTIRIRINLETIGGEKFQFCREYNVEEIKN